MGLSRWVVGLLSFVAAALMSGPVRSDGVNLSATASPSSSSRLPDIVSIKLKMSNAFLLKGEKVVLVDTGGDEDMPALLSALSREGVQPRDIALIVLTHAHSDHAGGAAELRALSKAKVVVGAGDKDLLIAGRNDELKPTGVMGWIVGKTMVKPTFRALQPDLVLNSALDLAPWGISGKIVPTAGHTPGSLSLLMTDGRAIVGDMLMGGVMGGVAFSSHAGEGYFCAHPEMNRERLAWLLNQGAKTLYLGHGGPVTAESARKAFGINLKTTGQH